MREQSWMPGGGVRAAVMVAAMLCMFVVNGAARAADEAALWSALRSGTAFAMIRHALAPGNGDPDNFALGDCATQRNLDDRGRAQARDAGNKFRAAGIDGARVYSSPWCRCMDTATGLDLGQVTVLPSLGSIHGRPELRAPQIRALRQWLAEDADRTDRAPLVLVSHHSVIGALTGFWPSSGEIVVVRRGNDDSLTVLGAL